MCCIFVDVFFFKQKTAYEMRISDWSSDVCSSDLRDPQCLAIGDRCRCDEVPDRFDRDSDREDRQHQRAGETREIADLAGAEGEARICCMPACEAIGECCGTECARVGRHVQDRKSTRLNPSN